LWWNSVAFERLFYLGEKPTTKDEEQHYDFPTSLLEDP